MVMIEKLMSEMYKVRTRIIIIDIYQKYHVSIQLKGNDIESPVGVVVSRRNCTSTSMYILHAQKLSVSTQEGQTTQSHKVCCHKEKSSQCMLSNACDFT